MVERLRKYALEGLLDQEPDRPLASLEADVWAAITRQAHARRVFRAVFAAQALVLTAALISSAVAGFHLAPVNRSGQLDVFSTRPILAASTLLAGREP